MWGSQLHFALLVIVSWRQLAEPPSDSDPNRSWPSLFKIPNSHLSHPSAFQTSKLQTFCDKLPTTTNQQTSGQQQSTTMDANDQKCGVEGTEGTPCKKHTIEQSPRKPSPAKVSSLPSSLFLSRCVFLFAPVWDHNTSPVPSASPPSPFFMLRCFTSIYCKTTHQHPASLSIISRTSNTSSLTKTVLPRPTHVCPPRLTHFTLATFRCQHPLCFFFHLEHSDLHL